MMEKTRRPMKPPDSLCMFFRVDDNVFRSSMPHTREEFEFLKAAGVDTIISFEPLGLGKLEAQSYGMRVIDYPLAEGVLPTKEQVDGFLQLIGEQIKAGHRVLIHCMAGKERTGLMAGFYLVRYHEMPPLFAYHEADKKFLGDRQDYKQFLLEYGTEIMDRHKAQKR